MNYKDGKWAREILNRQLQNGSWGYFHTLTKVPSKGPITTEQALRRLEILGFTIKDKPIQRTVKYLQNVLSGKDYIPDIPEKQLDWLKFRDLMISTWIKKFDPDNKIAYNVSKKWAEIVNNSFINGKFDTSIFEKLFYKILNYDNTKKPIRFMTLYPISLVSNILSKDIEPLFFNYILNYGHITYFSYPKPLTILPELFESKGTKDYIMEIELLTEYKNIECKKQLQFVKKWIEKNKINNNEWDIGKNANDGLNFPLSDSWRLKENRIIDCTYRINKILNCL